MDNPAKNIEPIPRQLALLKQDNETLVPAFVDSFRRWTAALHAGLPKEKNPHTVYPTKDVAEFAIDTAKSPPLHQQLLAEMYTFLRELEKNEMMLNGKHVYDHQFQQWIWFTLSLVNRFKVSKSFLFEGAPGVGKTLILGAVNIAMTRLQIRDVIQGRIMYASPKSFIITQQTLSPEDRVLRVHSPINVKDLNDHIAFIQQQIGAKHALTRPLWKDIVDQQPESPEAASILIRETMDQLELWPIVERMGSDPETFVQILSELASNRSAIVHATDEKRMPIRLPEAKKVDDGERQYSGDFGHGIPRSYVENGLVLTRKGGELDRKHLLGTGRTDEQKERDHVSRIVFALNTTLSNTAYRKSIDHLLAGTDVFIIDEARDPGSMFQFAVQDARKAKGEPKGDLPIVVGASAGRFANSSLHIPHHERYSPGLGLKEAITRGVLPPVGVDRWPNADEPHYPADSREAMEQLYEAHFEELELPAELNLPQPYECNGIIIVNPALIDETMTRLKAEYEKRGQQVDLQTFRENTQPPYSDRILTWALHEEKGIPHILVTNARVVTDSLDLPNIRNITIATHHGVNQETLLRLFGRLEHSNLHHSQGAKFRGYFRQGAYSDDDPKCNLFAKLQHDLKLSTSSPFSWAPLQILHGKKQARADQRLIENGEVEKKRLIPPVGKKPSKEMLRKGTKIAKKPKEHSLEVPLRPNRIVQNHAHNGWLRLSAENPLGTPPDVILQRIYFAAAADGSIPDAILQNWQAWSFTLRRVIEQSSADPVGNVRSRLIQAAENMRRRSDDDFEYVQGLKGNGVHIVDDEEETDNEDLVEDSDVVEEDLDELATAAEEWCAEVEQQS